MPNGTRTTVLIVDDDESVRLILGVSLELHGFNVIGGACDGRTAIEVATRRPPDVIVLDEGMPVMTGGEAAPLLRRAAPRTKIVAFSAGLQRKPDWADAFLSKTEIMEITAMVERLADGLSS